MGFRFNRRHGDATMKPKHDDKPSDGLLIPFLFFLGAGMFFAWASNHVMQFFDAFRVLIG